jgi:hypothetical protein
MTLTHVPTSLFNMAGKAAQLFVDGEDDGAADDTWEDDGVTYVSEDSFRRESEIE